MTIIFAPGAGPRRGRFRVLSDVLAALLVLAVFAALALGSAGIFAPLAAVTTRPISLDPARLPYYALRTVLRMLAAIAASLLFTFVYGTLAAKSRRAELVLDPAARHPPVGPGPGLPLLHRRLLPAASFRAACSAPSSPRYSRSSRPGLEHDLQLLPVAAHRAARSRRGGRAFRFTAWQRFWRLEVPFAMPGLIWNMMMSMSGGWFFVVAAEAITRRRQRRSRCRASAPISRLAIEQRDLAAIGWAILAMTIVIIVYDQLMFRPLVAWADKFRFEQTAREDVPHSWFLAAPAPLGCSASAPRRHPRDRRWLAAAAARLGTPPPGPTRAQHASAAPRRCSGMRWSRSRLCSVPPDHRDVRRARASLGATSGTSLRLGFYTLLRVVVLIALASLVWVPLGVMIGLRPRLAEARPAAGAVPRRLSGQSPLPAGRQSCIVRLHAQSEYLAEPAHDPRHAVVHSLQRDRRHDGLSDRLPRSGRRISASAAGNGGAT